MRTRKETFQQNRQQLHQLMQRVGISSIRELIAVSGVSGWQISRLQFGLLPKLSLETVVKLADALQISVSQLMSFCGAEGLNSELMEITESSSDKELIEKNRELSLIKAEYQRLEQQFNQQREILQQEFQQSSIEIIESWLLQWPTAVVAAKRNPQLSALKLLALVKPITELLKQWGIKPLGMVGDIIPYDPQWQQLMEGEANAGDKVEVRYVGYQQDEKLLYRAKVRPILGEKDNYPENQSQDSPKEPITTGDMGNQNTYDS